MHFHEIFSGRQSFDHSIFYAQVVELYIHRIRRLIYYRQIRHASFCTEANYFAAKTWKKNITIRFLKLIIANLHRDTTETLDTPAIFSAIHYKW